jgi:hypothetical protein
MWTRNGRLPAGVSMIFTIARATSVGSASFGSRTATPECHVTCVVHDRIDVPMSAYHAINGSVDGALRDDIHFDGAKIGLVVGREGLDRLYLSGIAACGRTHSGENRMTRFGEALRGHESETARGTGDDDDFVHIGSP